MPVSRTFEAIGTRWTIDLYSNISTSPNTLWNTIDTRIEIFDKHYSRFRKDSLVTEMSQNSGTYMLPQDAQPLFDTYKTLYTLTNGMFTPLIGQTLVAAGYDAQYSLKPHILSKPPTWDEALIYNYPHLMLKQPALLDFGAGGKGYLVDIVSEILKEFGINHFCVDAGGDMYYHNPESTPITVGLEHPLNSKKIIGVAHIYNQSIAGSAGNRRTWAEFHHMINPQTLQSPKNILATWVVASNTLIADALTTALYFVPPQTLLETYQFEYVIMYSDHSVAYSQKFIGEIYN